VGIGDCGDVGFFPAYPTEGINGGLAWPQVVVEGPVELELEPFTYGLCPPDFEYPRVTSVALARADLPDAPMEQAELAFGPGGSTVVRLPHVAPGLYRLLRTATPDPGTGKPPRIFESTFLALEDHRGAGVEIFPHACERVDRSTQGTWLCDHRVLRDGVLVEELPEGWRYAVSGSVVWGVSRDGGQVARWEDVGSGLLAHRAVLGPPDGADVSFPDPVLVASEEELLVRRNTVVELYRVSPDGGPPGWVSSTAVPVGRFLARQGPQLLLDDTTAIPGSGTAAPSLCPYWINASGLQRTEAPCVTAKDAVDGADEEGLWTTGAGLIRYAPVDGGVQVTPVFPRLLGLGSLAQSHGATGASPAYRVNLTGPGGYEDRTCGALSRDDGQPRRLELIQGLGPLLGARKELLWGEVDDAETPSTWVIER
jgi:hypothetical protein